MSRYDRYDDRDRRDRYDRDRYDRDRYDDRRRDRYDDRDRYDRRDRYDDRRRDRSPPRRHRDRPRVERTKFAVVVKNLSSSVTWADLKDEARRYGDVTYADANRLRTGEGVVSFKTRDDMIKCKKEMDDQEFFGRRVETSYEDPAVADGEDDRPVNNDYPKGSERQRSRSRDRSRERSSDRYNRSRSRSRSR